MKKFFISLIVACVFATAYAQIGSEHLTFKGIPIDGTLDEFTSKMKKAGFSYHGTEDGAAVFEGEFAGYKGCIIIVGMLESTNKVHTVGVLFPACKFDWSCLENTYESLKSMLSEKYGKYTDCIEEFQGYIEPHDDHSKFLTLLSNNCTYYTTFTTDKGNISLSLEKVDRTEACVKLQYWDGANTDEVKSNAMDDL